MEPLTQALHELEHGPLHRFADWPNPAIPNRRAGVYTVWRDDELLYVGMGGKGLVDDPAADPRKRAGLLGRLHSHASGQRSGDRFCIYVFDRVVLPTLTADQIEQGAAGAVPYDPLVRRFVREHLGYRFTLVADQVEAFVVERHVQREGLSGRRPLFNAVQ